MDTANSPGSGFVKSATNTLPAGNFNASVGVSKLGFKDQLYFTRGPDIVGVSGFPRDQRRVAGHNRKPPRIGITWLFFRFTLLPFRKIRRLFRRVSLFLRLIVYLLLFIIVLGRLNKSSPSPIVSKSSFAASVYGRISLE